MSSSSSSSSSIWQYDVFVSFRGDDVRRKFVNYFLKELDRKLINVFRDNLIAKGELLGPVLTKAIENSRIAIVVFSNNYASSRWCLNELLDIVRHKEGLDQLVIPIFYEINPSQVRDQTGEFGKIFKKTCKNATKDEIGLLSEALTKVGNLVGYHSLNSETETELIEDVVNTLLGRLNLTPSKDFEDFSGIEDHIGEMSSLLELETKPDSVKMVGIWGPSGIGKTTIARALYNRISHRFQGRIYIDRAFVSMSRERYSGCNPDDHNMKLHLEGNFLSEILGKEGIKAKHLGAVRDKLNHLKVIIFIDDLDDNVVLEVVADKVQWFGQGSRIVAITKDRQILRGHGIKCVYEVGIPSKELALQMLCRSAFKNNPPPDGVMELASEVVELMGALPLALTVLGSSLAGKERKSWEDMLLTLRESPVGKIEKALSISYQGLERKHQALFRHIACFFNGCETKNIKLMLADSDLAVHTGLEDLVDKSLIRVRPSWNHTEIVDMHCLLQELGKEIVRAQSGKPGEREFLMDSKDICHVLEGCSGTENVLGISLNLDEINMVEIDKDAFKGMSKLCFLKFYKKSLDRKKEVIWKLPKRFNHFPKGLKLLSWPEYPMEKMLHNIKANFIQLSTSEFFILPGEVLPYFTHRSTGSPLTIPLQPSPLSRQKSFLNFKACIVVSPESQTVEDNLCFFIDIKVEYRFRDKDGEYLEPAKQSELALHQTYKYNHQIIFDCRFPQIQRSDRVEIVFHLPKGLKLKGCGVRLLGHLQPHSKSYSKLYFGAKLPPVNFPPTPLHFQLQNRVTPFLGDDQGLAESNGCRLTKMLAKFLFYFFFILFFVGNVGQV